jgi:putative addiction module killer protein
MDLRKTEEFEAWFDGLKDRNAKIRIAARLARLEKGNAGDHAGVGDGVFELRLHFGPGYRIYYIQRGEALIILLAGGHKSTRARDIEKAKALAKEV